MKLLHSNSIKILFFIGKSKEESNFKKNFDQNFNIVEIPEILPDHINEFTNVHLDHCRCKPYFYKAEALFILKQSILVINSRKWENISSESIYQKRNQNRQNFSNPSFRGSF